MFPLAKVKTTRVYNHTWFGRCTPWLHNHQLYLCTIQELVLKPNFFGVRIRVLMDKEWKRAHVPPTFITVIESLTWSEELTFSCPPPEPWPNPDVGLLPAFLIHPDEEQALTEWDKKTAAWYIGQINDLQALHQKPKVQPVTLAPPELAPVPPNSLSSAENLNLRVNAEGKITHAGRSDEGSLFDFAASRLSLDLPPVSTSGGNHSRRKKKTSKSKKSHDLPSSGGSSLPPLLLPLPNAHMFGHADTPTVTLCQHSWYQRRAHWVYEENDEENIYRCVCEQIVIFPQFVSIYVRFKTHGGQVSHGKHVCPIVLAHLEFLWVAEEIYSEPEGDDPTSEGLSTHQPLPPPPGALPKWNVEEAETSRLLPGQRALLEWTMEQVHKIQAALRGETPTLSLADISCLPESQPPSSPTLESVVDGAELPSASVPDPNDDDL